MPFGGVWGVNCLTFRHVNDDDDDDGHGILHGFERLLTRVRWLLVTYRGSDKTVNI